MDLQTYYMFALTCKRAYAATDGHPPTGVYELMVAQYKGAVNVVVQQRNQTHRGESRLIVGHGRCLAGRSGHRCRGRVSAVAMTQLCPFHQTRMPVHHVVYIDMFTDRDLFN